MEVKRCFIVIFGSFVLCLTVLILYYTVQIAECKSKLRKIEEALQSGMQTRFQNIDIGSEAMQKQNHGQYLHMLLQEIESELNIFEQRNNTLSALQKSRLQDTVIELDQINKISPQAEENIQEDIAFTSVSNTFMPQIIIVTENKTKTTNTQTKTITTKPKNNITLKILK